MHKLAQGRQIDLTPLYLQNDCFYIYLHKFHAEGNSDISTSRDVGKGLINDPPVRRF
jgi:hypothetical protein